MQHRPTRAEDLHACLGLIPEAPVYDGETRPHLLRLWREVLAKRCGESAIIDDQERTPGSQIVGFGLSVFVTDEFAHEAKTRLPPYIDKQVLDRWARGRSPILDLDAIRAANSGDGLNLLIMQRAFAENTLTPDESSHARHLLFEAFIAHHRGYRLKEFVLEVYGEADLERATTPGARLLTDYAAFFRSGDVPPAPPGRHPYLIGTTRQEALAREGTYAFAVFSYIPPRFRFTPEEQDLLHHALLGRTDTELGHALHAALATVKKRWASIYDRIASVDPELLLGTADMVSPQGRRGPEKRRRLLEYLRRHPEELRPVNPLRP
jgi:hypothetical protein